MRHVWLGHALARRRSSNKGSNKRTFAAILLCGLLITTAAIAQQPGVQDSPPAPAQPIDLTHPVPSHRFWDRTNIMLFSGVAIFRGLDYASTRNFQARGRQEILLPDDVVNNSAGFAALEAAGTVTSVGLSYWMHRSGHHKLERWVSIGHISVTGFGVVRNYSLESKHPPRTDLPR
jgi:hypothetical protein